MKIEDYVVYKKWSVVERSGNFVSRNAHFSTRKEARTLVHDILRSYNQLGLKIQIDPETHVYIISSSSGVPATVIELSYVLEYIFPN